MEMNQQQLEAIELLKQYKLDFDSVASKQDAIKILGIAGKAVGYKPAMRVLVYGKNPDHAFEKG